MHYESNIRNPKAYFELFITSKGNLALDWYPYNPNLPGLAKEKWDWTHWDNKWPVGGNLKLFYEYQSSTTKFPQGTLFFPISFLAR